jgi:hypothetical protein
VRDVPSKRDLGRGERGAGVLLLHARVRASGRQARVPGVHARDVQQPAGEAGVLELLDRDVLAELYCDQPRDVQVLSGRAVVAGGEREL